MGNRKLLIGGKFSKGFAEGSIKEEGIVAKASLTTRPVEDDSVRAAFNDRQDPSRPGQSDDANVVRGALLGPNPAQFLQQLFIVRDVVSLRARPARRVDAGSAAESIDRDPRIVRKYQPAGAGAVVESLLAGIFLKCSAIF